MPVMEFCTAMKMSGLHDIHSLDESNKIMFKKIKIQKTVNYNFIHNRQNGTIQFGDAYLRSTVIKNSKKKKKKIPQMGREKVLIGVGSAWCSGRFCFFTRFVIPLGVCIMIIG